MLQFVRTADVLLILARTTQTTLPAAFGRACSQSIAEFYRQRTDQIVITRSTEVSARHQRIQTLGESCRQHIAAISC